MNDQNVQRKLAAIFHSDVVGYSILMGDDEVATVHTISEYRDMMAKLIRQYRGRVVDTSGDNVLAEFSSVIDAMQSAVSIQKELKARNAKLLQHRRMQFRIGINIGEVIQEGDRIYGDGVNIAARLESLARPGGICISRVAFDQIESKLPLGYEYIGEQSLKNISKPLHAYHVLLEEDDVLERKTEKAHRGSKTRDPQSHHEAGGDRFERSFHKVKGHMKDFAKEIKEDENIGDTFKEIKGRFRHFKDEMSGSPENRKKAFHHMIQSSHMRFIIGSTLFLFLINALTSFGHWWFLYPVISIGLGVYLHWLKVSFFSPEKVEKWRQRLIQKELSLKHPDLRDNKDEKVRIEKMANARIQFYNHLYVYVGVNLFLIFINLISNPFSWWFPFPLIGWGFGLFMHWMKIKARLPNHGHVK
jgi:class 3 adenylate cyclase